MEHSDEHIYTFRASRPGASVLIIGGTHGNEQIGIACVESLREELAAGTLRLKAGTLRLALGNPQAVERRSRLSDAGSDLNRSFTRGLLEKKGDDLGYEVKRAQKLAPYIRASDIVIDMHSTQRPSATAFVSSRVDDRHERVYRWFAPITSVVVQDPNYVLAGTAASIDEYADLEGKIGICFESGYYGDVSQLEKILDSLRAIMADNGMLHGEWPAYDGPTFERFHWEESVPYDPRKGWQWAPGIVIRSFEPVPKGTVIGYSGSEPVTRDYDAYLLFPKTEEVMVAEERVTYLARRI